ncbi:unnamed protein product [Leptidea sinapis]|uniref:Peptidase S1 domain-containing protein n=1 Tax=Leptidea sinapis TaxID=189913 RepID=A0A5E4QKH1_9NEOP|nr:unnamed protein product [Leptidea sinapis]
MWFVLFSSLLCHQALSHYIPSNYAEPIQGRQGRIVSGWDAELGQFPYQAYVRAVDNRGNILTCSGSVIDAKWVLSSAACVAGRQSVTVLAGLTNVNNAEYVSETRRWYTYPTFDVNEPGRAQQNDISLIYLPIAMTFTDNLKSIQLQSRSDAYNDYTGVQLTASGWGLTWTNGFRPTELQWVYLSGVPDAQCRGLFGNIVNQNTLCARYWNVTTQSICEW